MDLVKNAAGRLVPTSLNGFPFEPYQGAFADLPQGPFFVAPTRTQQLRGASKIVKNLDDLVTAYVPDGGWVSTPHYYRDDPTSLQLIVDSLRRCGKRDVKLLGIAFFQSHADVILPALADGTLGGIEGNVYGPVAKAVASGSLGDWIVVGRTHGGRARCFQQGEREVDLAIAPVPIADAWGNANGVMGHPSSLCGPLGLFAADAMWAKRTVLLAETIHPTMLAPHPIQMSWVDHVVPVACAGNNRGIGTGTTDVRRVKGDPERLRIAANVLRVMDAAGVVQDGFNFQVGSGAGLLVLEKMLRKMRAEGIRAGFTVGGSMEYHVDMLEEGLIELYLDGQCFQPSPRLFHSLLHNPRHVEVSTPMYYSPACKQEACGLMDVVVLGASEIDVNFNANTVTGYDGMIRTGIGGGPDAASGAKLTIFALPIARVNRGGESAPCIRQAVSTIVTPGEVIDVVVTEEHVALNPSSDSPYLPAVRENARREGLEIVTIEEMAAASLAKAQALGTLMAEPRYTDEIVYAVEWRDGRLLDVVRKLEP